MFDTLMENELKTGDTPEHYRVRQRMIRDQILSRGISDALVIQALERVPRHRFVGERLEKSAYDDTPLPVSDGQTISQPFIVAYMTAALELRGGEKILEVGAGSGYQAAVLAEIVAQVYTIEINENLTIEASRRFKKMGYDNIFLKFGDGYKGWPEHAPFDGIVVTAAPDHVPRNLVDQLRIGGRMIIPVGDVNQDLLVVFKQSDGTIRKESRIPVRFVPMLGEAEKKTNLS
ncbi:MAG TPA: protein-L-isoaspartate(D-aspartate) O-methyltransferase [bacterium]